MSWVFPILAMRVTPAQSARPTRPITGGCPTHWRVANNSIAMLPPPSCATAIGITPHIQPSGTLPFQITPSQVRSTTPCSPAGGQRVCHGPRSGRTATPWLAKFLLKSDFHNSAVARGNHPPGITDKSKACRWACSTQHTSFFIVARRAAIHGDNI